MLFSSAVFLFVFLPFVLIGYYLINPMYRNIFLLLASLFFYSWGEPIFIFVMIASIIINYFSGVLIDSTDKYLYLNKLRLPFLVACIASNLGLLFYYKYFDFAVINLNHFFHLNLNVRNIALPIGISFFTFQGMSYVIDLYRRNIPVQKNPLSLALYISMFPQLIAGPIVRYADVYLQISNRTVDLEKFAYGIQRFVIGLAKKVLIANVLAEVADKIFATQYNQIDPATAWVGAICYSMQIFFDFSGYSDMAIGLGKMFGFDFMENFNLPYISKSITEFWRRWHISLSTWFRDYLYIPLGGNRSGNVYVNLIIVFIATGLWHGAAWTFLCWGLWHGTILIIERLFRNRNISLTIPYAIRWMYTMFLVQIGWVIFRSDDILSAYHYLLAMFNMVEHGFVPFSVWWYLDKQILFTLIIAIIVSSKLPSLIMNKIIETNFYQLMTIYIKPFYLLFIMICNIIFIVNGNYNPFIYFRF